MELWIRTQDRMRLLKPNRLAIKGESKLVGLGDWYITESQNSLRYATYHTKERALEVLDEIQKILQPQMVLSKVGKPIAETCEGLVYTEPNEYEIKELSTYVYEMPKE